MPQREHSWCDDCTSYQNGNSLHLITLYYRGNVADFDKTVNPDPIFSPKTYDQSAIDGSESWSTSLSRVIRCPDELIDALGLPDALRQSAHHAAAVFPLVVTRSFLRRMEYGNVADPVLRQVLPLGAELKPVVGFVTDAVDDSSARKVPGLLHKYDGRALFIATGTCAINCRYCFRRSYPYAQEPRRLDDWEPAF